MCGLTGYWKATSHSAKAATAIVGAMARQIAHRGPDVIRVCGQMPMRGLLSPQGHPPMMSHCWHYVIAFNGEIYKLRGYQVDWNGWVWHSIISELY